MPAGSVTGLFVYPVKGLSPQPLDELSLRPGLGVPRDREWALARPDGRYRPGTHEPIPKDQFFMLVKDARLAGLDTRLDGDSHLTISVREHHVLDVDLDTTQGRFETSAFFGRVLDMPPGTGPVIAREPGRRFTDVSVVSDAMMNAVSFINLASIRALEHRVGADIDPLRFRGNIYFDGLPPFSELDLVGRKIQVGDVTFTAVLNTRRCAATEVNPRTAHRDLPIPRLLMQHFGHAEMGVYGEVTSPGRIKPGDPITFATPGPAQFAKNTPEDSPPLGSTRAGVPR